MNKFYTIMRILLYLTTAFAIFVVGRYFFEQESYKVLLVIIPFVLIEACVFWLRKWRKDNKDDSKQDMNSLHQGGDDFE